MRVKKGEFYEVTVGTTGTLLEGFADAVTLLISSDETDASKIVYVQIADGLVTNADVFSAVTCVAIPCSALPVSLPLGKPRSTVKVFGSEAFDITTGVQ